MKKNKELSGGANFPGPKKVFRIMKLTVFLILISMLSVFAGKTYSQSKMLNLSMEQVSVREVLSEIENQSDFHFMYSSSLIDVNRLISINVKDARIDEILNSIFEGTDVSYTIKNRFVVISTAEGTSMQQQKSVLGRVTDSSNAALPGVTVVVKGTTNGTVTDFDGNYSINNVPSDGILVFSFVGMKTQEVSVSGKSSINVSLVEDAIGIEEVVAIGYGTMKKSDLTGSIASIKSEELHERASSNLGQALQGKVSGVLIRNISSAPGGGVSIIIRGHNSVASDSQPLYIVDGLPLDNINSIPVENIESVEILKDASSTSIYGSRGANGVVLITTINNTSVAKSTISYDYRLSFETLPTDLNLMNAEEFATIYTDYELSSNPNLDQSLVWFNGSSYDRPLPSEAGEGTNWFKEISRTGIIQNHLLTLTGGSERIKYSVSANYLRHKGMILCGKYNRTNLKSNLSFTVTDWLKGGVNIFFNHNQTNSSGENEDGNVISQAILMVPTMPVYAPDGTYQLNNFPGSASYENPVALAEEVEDYKRENKAFGNMYITISPLEDLIMKFSLGGDVSNIKEYYYNPATTFAGRMANGIASLAVYDKSYIVNENTATYHKKFLNHELDLLAGFTNEKQVNEFMDASAKDFFTDKYLYNNLAAGKLYGIPNSSKTEWSLMSFLGRINYILSEKYMLTLSGRYDGSSKFGSNNKWGFFPSIAGAWHFKEEEFMKEIHWLTFGKFRVSYGTTGNQNIGLYNSLATYNLANYPFGEKIQPGVALGRLENSMLRWEKTSTFDLGADVGISDKIMITIDCYKKKTSDMLLGVSVVETTGFSNATMNSGKMENRGFELSVDANLIDNKLFKWNSVATFFQNRNRITDIIDPKLKWNIGYPIGAFQQAVVDGIIHTQEELDAYSDANGNPINGAKLGYNRFVDSDSDGKITGLDQRVIFNPEPDFSLSLKNEFSWKDLSLSIFTYGNIGGQIMNYYRTKLTGLNMIRENKSKDLLTIKDGVIIKNYWTNETPYAQFATFRAPGTEQLTVEDGTFFKIQDISLSYKLPMRKSITSAKIYLSVQNIYTFTNYSGWDPDVSSKNTNKVYGVDIASHPVPRTFTFGINLTL